MGFICGFRNASVDVECLLFSLNAYLLFVSSMKDFHCYIYQPVVVFLSFFCPLKPEPIKAYGRPSV